MSSTYSPLLRIELIGTGDQPGTWGDTTNTNLGSLIEQAIAGTATFSVTATDVTLSALNGSSDQSRCMALLVTGTPSATRNIIAPASSKIYVVSNTSDSSVVLKTSVSTGLTIPSGITQFAYYNGTDFIAVSQPYDADLKAIADLATTGIIVRTGSGTAATRSIAVSGTGLSVSNADGVSGNPTVASNATSSNTVSTLVARDSSGNFSAGTVTATLSGTATSVSNSVTFAETGGASPSTTYNGSAARTVDYSTVGAPKADGTGASGTWNIAISGNAATATSATSATNATNVVSGGTIASNVTATTQTLGDSSTKVATTAFVQAALQALYPVGSVYINASVNTSPATLLGFGTWAAIGTGRVLVGQDTGDTSFDVMGETGGSKDSIVVAHTHTGTTDSGGTHTHTITDPGHTHGLSQLKSNTNNLNQQGFYDRAAGGTATAYTTDTATTGISVNSGGAHTHAFTTGSTGSSGTNANLPPYVVVKMWQRTA